MLDNGLEKVERPSKRSPRREGIFGREAPLAALLRGIGDGRSSPPLLLRVAGESGIGKSSMIAAMIPTLRMRGINVVSGKFDQLERVGPYSAFAQAFAEMLQWILSQSNEDVARWRARISVALAPNTQVLLDLLPDYEMLLGPQPPVPKLGLSEDRIRTSLVSRRFVGALAAETPLVIVLDDLQWADDASLSLIETLASDPEIANLTILTSFRDNEVDSRHPATLMFARLAGHDALRPIIELRGLVVEGVRAILSETLGTDDVGLKPLAQLVHRKTRGNPLFVRQFIATLRRKKLIEVREGKVHFDRESLSQERFTDNVVDLVIERIRALPDDARRLVEIASCVLERTDHEDLAVISDMSVERVEKALVPAFQADILRPSDTNDTVRFQHDKVREGAYALVPLERRSAIHAALARRTEERGVTGGREQINLADHLLAGRDHLDPSQQKGLRDALLAAAEVARRGNAHGSALTYLNAAVAMQADFDTRLRRAELLYLLGRYDDADHEADALLPDAPDTAAQVRALRLKVTLATATLNYRKALRVGQRALALLDEDIAIDPSRASVLASLAATQLRLRSRRPEALLQLPRMQNEQKRAAMEMLLEMAPAAYFASELLLPSIAMRMVQLSLSYGNAPASAYGYALFGIVHSAVLHDPRRGLAYGDLARRAVSALNARELDGRVFMIYAGFLLHWTAPLRRTLPIYLDGAERAIESGDLDNHGYLRYGHASYAFMAGAPLDQVDAFLQEHLEAVTLHRHDKTQRIMTMARASIARMRGKPADPYDEADYLRVWNAQRDATSLAYYHKYRMLEALMEDDAEEVLQQAAGMTENLNGILGMAYQPFYTFYEALASLDVARKSETSHVRRRILYARAARLTRRLARWAKGGATTIRPRVLLLRAELAARRGATGRAMRLYDEALSMARREQALHDIGLFHERLAAFQAQWGANVAAQESRADAIAALRDWGAHGWADRVFERHRTDVATVLRVRGTNASEPSVSTEAIAAGRDGVEVAHELALDLRDRTGAAAVRVLLAGEERKRLVSVSRGSSEPEVMENPSALGAHLPQMAANYALRTREAVVIDHDYPVEPFASDPYRMRRENLDIVCVPMLTRDDVLGVACLEFEGGQVSIEEARRTASGAVGRAAAALQNASLVERLRTSLDRQVDLTSAHARFVPHAFLEVIGRPSIADVRLGDHRQRSASVLFSDIRGFTSRLESLSPADALAFVNGYLSLMEPFVQEQGGFIDSYIGDAVMAVFDRGPEASIRCAGAMQRALRGWRGVDTVLLEEPLRIGIGVASGDLIFGTLGAANRLKCGVVGDVVNLAARVEGMTAAYGCPVLTTQETVAALPDDLAQWTRPAGWTHVRGREAAVCLAEAFHMDDEETRVRKAATRAALDRFTQLQGGDREEEARQTIVDAAIDFPDDPLILALRERFDTPE